jgi:hypothetical protein
MVDLPFLLSLGEDSVYLILTVGLIATILTSAFVGHIFLTRHLTRKPVWSLATSVGLLLGFAYFACRSFLANFLQFPGILPFELFIITFIAAFYIPNANKVFFKIHLSLPGISCLVILLSSILIFGSWHYFSLVPVSSDPAVLANLIDIVRDHGSYQYRVSEQNPLLPSYPNGIIFLAMSFLNPLIPTQSFPHLWPFLSFSLLIGVWAELVLVRKEESSSVLFIIAILISTLVFRLFYPFDLSYTSPYLEGISKKTVFFPIALSLGLVIMLNKFRLSAWTNSFVIFIALLGGMMPFLVNPSNWAVSATVMSLIIPLLFIQSHLRPSFMKGLGFFTIFSVVYLLQEPIVLKSITFDSPLCTIFREKMMSCVDPLYFSKISSNGFHAHNPQVTDRWQDYLPVFSEDYSQFLTAGILQPVFVNHALFLGLTVVTLGLLISLRNRDWFFCSLVALSILSILLFIGFYHFQVFAFYTVIGQQIKHLLKGYTEQSFYNLWVMFFCLFTIYPLTSVLLRIRDLGLRKLLMCASAILIVYYPAKQAWDVNVAGITWLKEKTQPLFGAGTRSIAKLSLNSLKLVPPNSRVLVPGTMLSINHEDWFFPTYSTIGTVMLSDYEAANNFSVFWDVLERPYMKIYRSICETPCENRKDLNVQFAIGFEDDHFCGMSITTWAERNKACLNEATILKEKNLPAFVVIGFK